MASYVQATLLRRPLLARGPAVPARIPMAPQMLRVAGAGSSPYRLGDPMQVYEGPTHIGTFERMAVARDGHEVHLESLTVSTIVTQQKRKLRKLALLEATAFIADNFPSVDTVRLSLRSHMDSHDDGITLARIRAELLRRICAEEINIAPNFEPPFRGHFLVSGVWKRSRRNLEALAATLQFEREAYRASSAARIARARLLGHGARIRRLLSGRGA